MPLRKTLAVFAVLYLLTLPYVSAREFRPGSVTAISNGEDAFLLVTWWLYDYQCQCPGTEPCCSPAPVSAWIDIYHFNGTSLSYVGRSGYAEDMPVAFVPSGFSDLPANAWLVFNGTHVFWFMPEERCVRTLGELRQGSGSVRLSPPTFTSPTATGRLRFTALPKTLSLEQMNLPGSTFPTSRPRSTLALPAKAS
ncbi:hypothetical protein E3E36_01850 [Thermococcus sp. M36]|uniref:hypothetical protein n=1 Tax=Thermococcus sp. M36 TaxID=1638261 RepID=UPI00143BDD26|nr:hypothetical protein [Thermococcus sp. M36]NJE04913.1 hypothetical protein [Thermococcus sp. M36]